jgi:hypothetical protein
MILQLGIYPPHQESGKIRYLADLSSDLLDRISQRRADSDCLQLSCGAFLRYMYRALPLKE